MRLSAPIPWHLVPAGAVVMLDGAPRTVLANRSSRTFTGGRELLVEGLRPREVANDLTVQLVMLDAEDAVATLARAGLNPEEIAP